ncbi:MAG: Potassium efflux system KefA protein / Small-conductance mechanosensitive channel [uncultured Caballeronia sp.]|nr:MAG: Potassium efflux system KefA protein / Small-conductance mechanosensitive channel [uncultured Caballeronia sp.]
MTILSKDNFGAAAKLAVFYLFCVLRTAMKPCRIRAHAVALVLAALVSSALSVFSLNANAAPPALTLPSFQELINKPAAPSPGSASAVASGTADATVRPASDADLTRSLDTVISTLDNDRERTALVAQLKKLRDAKRDAQAAAQPADSSAASDGSGAAVLPEVAAVSSASASVVAAITPKTGLLGVIASGLSSLEDDFRHGRTPLNYWGGRLNAAGNELFTIVSGQNRESFGHTLLDYCLMLAGWGVCAFLLVYFQRYLHARYNVHFGLRANPTTSELLIFTLRRIGPYLFAFIAALTFVRLMPVSLGRTLAMVTAYAIVAGAVFSSICLIMFSLFGSEHRRVAVHLLILHARRLLFLIGTLGALGDAASNYDVAQQLGTNLSGLLSTVANMGAAVLTSYFTLAFRRPVSHLIRSRSYEQRSQHKAATETFEVVGSLWQVPMLLASASVIATLAGIGTSENVLQMAIATAGLLVVGLFLSAVVLRVTRLPQRKRRRQSAYVRRLFKFFGRMVVLMIWLAFIELASRFWGVSLTKLTEESVAARGITHAVSAILLTILIAWLVWILIDTGIQEALNPNTPRSKGRGPSMRARTMLPLIRNVVFVGLLTVAAIITATNLGLNVTPLLAGAGVIGLAVGFGAQSLLADLITGLFILIEDTISVGDSIEVDGGHAGVVETLTIRTLRLRDGQGAIHTIPFSQIKVVKNLSRDFAYAVFEVRVPFSADVDQITQMIREVGAELMADFRYRREMLGPIEVWGLDRFDPNWMVMKGQIKTLPLKQWSVARAFNVRVKRKMDEIGMDVPVPQMQLRVSREFGGMDTVLDDVEELTEAAPLSPVERSAATMARDISHKSQPAPPPTDQSVQVPPQIPTASEPGKA